MTLHRTLGASLAALCLGLAGLGLVEPSSDQSGVQLEVSAGRLTIRNYYYPGLT